MYTAFNYLYCNANNDKNYGTAIFKGIINKNPIVELQNHLDARQYFIAEQIGVPTLFSWSDEDQGDGIVGPTEIDHCWHTVFSLTAICTPEYYSEQPNTYMDSRTIEKLLADVEAASRVGWKAYVPE